MIGHDGFRAGLVVLHLLDPGLPEQALRVESHPKQPAPDDDLLCLGFRGYFGRLAFLGAAAARVVGERRPQDGAAGLLAVRAAGVCDAADADASGPRWRW